MADTIAEFIRQQNAARQKQTVGAASVVLASVEDQPDQVAGDLQLANEYGKLTGNPVPPAPMVKEYRGLFQAEIERKQASAWLNSAPTLAEFVRNPENAALVRDDLSALSAWDKMRKAAATGEAKLIEDSYEFRRDVDASLETSAFGRGMDAAGDAFDRAILTNADGTPNFLGRLANYAREKGTARDGVPRDIIGGAQVTPDERAAAMMAQGFGPIYDGAKAVIKQMEAEGFAPMNFKDVNGIGSALSFIGENLAMSAPQMATTIAAGPLGPVMSLMGMGGEANAELKERAADLPQDQRVAIATGAGTLMAALDLFGLSRIFGGVGAGQVATDAVAGTLADRVIANGGTQALGRVLTAAITEGSTESLQEAIVMGVTALAGGDYKQAEVIDRLAQAFFAGAGAGADGCAGGAPASVRGGGANSGAPLPLSEKIGANRWSIDTVGAGGASGIAGAGAGAAPGAAHEPNMPSSDAVALNAGTSSGGDDRTGGTSLVSCAGDDGSDVWPSINSWNASGLSPVSLPVVAEPEKSVRASSRSAPSSDGWNRLLRNMSGSSTCAQYLGDSGTPPCATHVRASSDADSGGITSILCVVPGGTIHGADSIADQKTSSGATRTPRPKSGGSRDAASTFAT